MHGTDNYSVTNVLVFEDIELFLKSICMEINFIVWIKDTTMEEK